MNDSIDQTLDLVRQAQAGSSDALSKLLYRFQDRILEVIRLRMGPKLRRRYESQDLVQETLMAAFKDFDRFEIRSDARFLNWVSRIAENRILAAQKHESYEKRDPDRERSLDAPAPGQEGTRAEELIRRTRSPDEKVAVGQDSERLQECLQELPEQYRELIVLRNYLEMSWQDIADEVGRPSAAAARVMHAKAMEELQRRMARGVS